MGALPPWNLQNLEIFSIFFCPNLTNLPDSFLNIGANNIQMDENLYMNTPELNNNFELIHREVQRDQRGVETVLFVTLRKRN